MSSTDKHKFKSSGGEPKPKFHAAESKIQPIGQSQAPEMQSYNSTRKIKTSMFPTMKTNTEFYKTTKAPTSDTSEVYVKKWVDYSSKYGLGYLLSNGSSGVFFNDSTKIILE